MLLTTLSRYRKYIGLGLCLGLGVSFFMTSVQINKTFSVHPASNENAAQVIPIDTEPPLITETVSSTTTTSNDITETDIVLVETATTSDALTESVISPSATTSETALPTVVSEVVTTPSVFVEDDKASTTIRAQTEPVAPLDIMPSLPYDFEETVLHPDEPRECFQEEWRRVFTNPGECLRLLRR